MAFTRVLRFGRTVLLPDFIADFLPARAAATMGDSASGGPRGCIPGPPMPGYRMRPQDTADVVACLKSLR